MSLTTPATRAVQRTSDPFGFLELLTITGGGIVTPVRLVNDTRNASSNGNLFLALPFQVVKPRDASKETPRASLRIDNVGREIGQELEALEPGAELTATLQFAYRATPDTIEYEFTAPLSGVRANVFSISAVMGPTDLMRRPVVNIRFDPFTAPGLFPD
jgi:Domain of unknown function (DUF1833)